jgi:hypothetical protein
LNTNDGTHNSQPSLFGIRSVWCLLDIAGGKLNWIGSHEGWELFVTVGQRARRTRQEAAEGQEGSLGRGADDENESKGDEPTGTTVGYINHWADLYGILTLLCTTSSPGKRRRRSRRPPRIP